MIVYKWVKLSMFVLVHLKKPKQSLGQNEAQIQLHFGSIQWNRFCELVHFVPIHFKHAKIRGAASRRSSWNGSTAAGLSGWNGSTAAWIRSSAGLRAVCAGSSCATESARVCYRAVRAGDGAVLSDGDAAFCGREHELVATAANCGGIRSTSSNGGGCATSKY